MIYENIDHAFIKLCIVKKISLGLIFFTPTSLSFSNFRILSGCLGRKHNSKG